ncbi:MAG: hypothetical protein ACFBRM_06070 [Pikeienuella sp.]
MTRHHRPVLVCFAALCLVFLPLSPGAQENVRIRNQDACLNELQKTFAVDSVSRIAERRNGSRRYVRAWAVQEDGSRVLFRCRTSYGALRAVEAYSADGDWAVPEPKPREEPLTPEDELVFTGQARARRDAMGAGPIAAAAPRDGDGTADASSTSQSDELDTSGLDGSPLDQDGLDVGGEDGSGVDRGGLEEGAEDRDGVDSAGVDEETLDRSGVESGDPEGEETDDSLARPRFITVQ